MLALYPRRFLSLLRQSPVAMALILWAVLVVVFFSISPGKRSLYLLPAVPAVAMVSGYLFCQLAERQRFIRLANGVIAVLAAGLIIVSLCALLRAPFIVRQVADYAVDADALTLLALTLAGLGVALLCTLLVKTQILVRTLAAEAVLVIGIGLLVFPQMQAVRTPLNVMGRLHEVVPAEQEVAVLPWKSQYLLYSRRPLFHAGFNTPADISEGAIWRWARQLPSRWVMVPQSLPLQCFDTSQAIFIGTAHRDDWQLLPPSAAKSVCSLNTEGRVYRSAAQQQTNE